jgi:RimJ/RimL family protein N-acetyltransferase
MLRAMHPEDLERLWEFNNDLEVELFGGGGPPYPQSLARLKADFEREWAKGGAGRYKLWHRSRRQVHRPLRLVRV